MIYFHSAVLSRALESTPYLLGSRSNVKGILVTSKSITQHLKSYQFAFLDKKELSVSGNRPLFPGTLQRKNLIQAIIEFDFHRPPHKEFSAPLNGVLVESTILLARLAAAESLPDAIVHIKALLKYSKASDIESSEKNIIVLNALQCFSVTLTQLAHSYFSRTKGVRQHAERGEGMMYLRSDFSAKSGYFKDLLDAGSQFLHDAIIRMSVSPLHWLNHFALLKMGNLHEHVSTATFDMWVESYRKWLFDIEKKYSESEVEPIRIQLTQDKNAILNATAVCMIEWCEKTQILHQTSEVKRIAQIWSMFLKKSTDLSFVPSLHLIAKICDSLRWIPDTGGLAENLFVTMQSKVSFSVVLYAPWILLRSIILILPKQNAVAAIFLRQSIEVRTRQEDTLPEFSNSGLLSYHLLHTLFLVFVKSNSIAESENIFRSSVPISSRRKFSKSTLSQAKSSIAQDSDERREHMILIMLSLYAYLPIPDIQSALDICETYLKDDDYTVEHFNLLLRAASNEPNIAYALYIDACSRGISIDRKGYDMLYSALGKGSRWITQSTLTRYEEMNASEIDKYASIPEASGVSECSV